MALHPFIEFESGIVKFPPIYLSDTKKKKKTPNFIQFQKFMQWFFIVFSVAAVFFVSLVWPRGLLVVGFSRLSYFSIFLLDYVN